MTDEGRAERDAHTAWTYAINSVMRENHPLPGQSASQVFDGCVTDLLDEVGADPDRLYAAARAACISAAEEVAHPGRWRQSVRAVELCQRAACMAAALR